MMRSTHLFGDLSISPNESLKASYPLETKVGES